MNIESFVNNPLVNVGSLAIAVLAVVLAIIFYIRSQKNKTPCFGYSSKILIEGLHKSLDGIEVHYKGVSQERITITKIVFWNDGRETIDGKDLVQKDPLRIVCPNDIDILDVQVVSDHADLNSIIIGDAPSDEDSIFYPVSFDYLDHKEYFVVQLIHSGNASREFPIEGKIKGVKNISEVSYLKAQPEIFKYFPFMGWFFSSPIVQKFVSLTYFSLSMFAIWNLIIGNTQWYVWLAVPLCLLLSSGIYFESRYISPVKI